MLATRVTRPAPHAKSLDVSDRPRVTPPPAATPAPLDAPPGFLRSDLPAGLTVALVTIPQCMAFATIAGLPPVSGLYTAVAMSLVTALLSKSPKLVTGPSITASTMLMAVLRIVAPDEPHNWPAIAALIALLAGLLTLLGAVLRAGRFMRFVSRSVILGLVVGSVILTIGVQLAPLLGVPSGGRSSFYGIVAHTVTHVADTRVAPLLMGAATCVLVLLAARFIPRWPGAFIVLVMGGAVVWLLDRLGIDAGLATIGSLKWTWPDPRASWYSGPYSTDLLVGAAAICLVGIIQNLAIARAMAMRDDADIDAQRELQSLGVANIAAGLCNGFPGSGSFVRSALSDLAGARTRLAGVVSAVAIAMIAALAAPLARYITLAAIAGLLIATALVMIDRRELTQVVMRDRDDRRVLGVTVACVFFLPLHWAVLIGLAASVVLFLRRVARLHLFEMVRDENGAFRERRIDEQTGRSAITMLQVEGPLFFAHADEMADTLQAIMRRGPRTVILRMRRTRQIDFSVTEAMRRVIVRYLADGGRFIVCGVTPKMHRALMRSPLGWMLGEENILESTRQVFGAATRAIEIARQFVATTPGDGRPLFREESAESAPV